MPTSLPSRRPDPTEHLETNLTCDSRTLRQKLAQAQAAIAQLSEIFASKRPYGESDYKIPEDLRDTIAALISDITNPLVAQGCNADQDVSDAITWLSEQEMTLRDLQNDPELAEMASGDFNGEAFTPERIDVMRSQVHFSRSMHALIRGLGSFRGYKVTPQAKERAQTMLRTLSTAVDKFAEGLRQGEDRQELQPQFTARLLRSVGVEA